MVNYSIKKPREIMLTEEQAKRSAMPLRQVLKSRKVKKLKGYYSYKHYADCIRTVFSQALSMSLEDAAELEIEMRNKIIKGKKLEVGSQINDCLFLFALIEDFPIYYLQENLCESLIKTEVCKEFDSSLLFAENGIILFPKNNILGLKSFTFSSAFNKNKVEGVFICEEGGRGLDNRGCYFHDQASVKDIKKNRDNGLVPNKKYHELFENIVHYKYYVEKKILSETIAKVPTHLHLGKKPKTKSIYIPKIIGEDYKQKVQYVKHIGTHSSPKMHWRSGHWRNQPTKEETKLIWIEPTIVNAGVS